MRVSNMAMCPACLNSPLEPTTKQRMMLWSYVFHATLSQYRVTLSEQWHGLCHIDDCSCYQHKNSEFYRNYYTKFVLYLNKCLIVFTRMSKTYTWVIQKISSICEYCHCSTAVTMVRMHAEFVDSVARHGRSLQTFEQCLRIVLYVYNV